MFIIVPVFSLIHLCYYKMLSFASEREYFILFYFTLLYSVASCYNSTLGQPVEWFYGGAICLSNNDRKMSFKRMITFAVTLCDANGAEIRL